MASSRKYSLRAERRREELAQIQTISFCGQRPKSRRFIDFCERPRATSWGRIVPKIHLGGARLQGHKGCCARNAVSLGAAASGEVAAAVTLGDVGHSAQGFNPLPQHSRLFVPAPGLAAPDAKRRYAARQIPNGKFPSACARTPKNISAAPSQTRLLRRWKRCIDLGILIFRSSPFNSFPAPFSPCPSPSIGLAGLAR